VLITEQEFIKNITRSNLLCNLFIGILIAFETVVCVGSLYIAFNKNITSKPKPGLIANAVALISLVILTLIRIKSRNNVLHINNKKSKEKMPRKFLNLKSLCN
jgi:uncharacterized protein with PQ loop repeat